MYKAPPSQNLQKMSVCPMSPQTPIIYSSITCRQKHPTFCLRSFSGCPWETWNATGLPANGYETCWRFDRGCCRYGCACGCGFGNGFDAIGFLNANAIGCKRKSNLTMNNVRTQQYRLEALGFSLPICNCSPLHHNGDEVISTKQSAQIPSRTTLR